MENLFDSLCAALLRKENRVVFLKDEGNELMYIMLKLVFGLYEFNIYFFLL